MASFRALSPSARLRLLAPLRGQLRAAVVGGVAAAGLLAVLTELDTYRAAMLLGGLVACLVVAWFFRHVGAALGIMIVYVPLQILPLAYMYKHGAPVAVVKNLGYVKEAVVLAVCMRAFAERRSWRPADAVDWMALIYAGIATAYLLLPLAAPGSLGGNSFSVRLNAWRLDTLFVIAFLACRRLQLEMQVVARLRVVAVGLATAVAGFAVWESVNSGSYDRAMVSTFAAPTYLIHVLQAPMIVTTSVLNRGTAIGSHVILRDGGPFLDPLALGFYSLIGLGIALERLTADRFRVGWALGAAASGAGAVLSVTRSAIIGGLTAIALTFMLARPGVRRIGRRRLTYVVAAGVAVLVLIGLGSALSLRFGNVFNVSSNSDNQGHLAAVQQSLRLITSHPAGLGLGANPVTGQLYTTSNLTISEDAYLQVGTELGIAAMLCFILMIWFLLRTLIRTARSATSSVRGSLAGGMWLAGVALAIGGLTLHVWTSLAVSLTFWSLCGVALSQPLASDSAAAIESPLVTADTR